MKAIYVEGYNKDGKGLPVHKTVTLSFEKEDERVTYNFIYCHAHQCSPDFDPKEQWKEV